MNVLWTAFFSIAVFAGSARMLSVSLIDGAAPLLQVSVLNFRHTLTGAHGAPLHIYIFCFYSNSRVTEVSHVEIYF